MNLPHHPTALRSVCALKTPSALLNETFRYAKDNIARCMRWYSLGWGMSNCPHASTLVVGRDTGWMCLGTDYVAPWFAPEALRVFRDLQKPNGQVVEYADMETGDWDDYGLNIGDNTPLTLWAVWHHWNLYRDAAFREAFLPFARAAGDHLLREIGPDGLLSGIPAGDTVRGIFSWRNIIPGKVLAGEVTEINCLSAMALRLLAEFAADARYAEGASRVAAAVNEHLWTGETYLLHRFDGRPDAQATGDLIFPVLTGVAPPERARTVLERLGQPDFWNARGLRTVPNSDLAYSPNDAYGLLGGSWPNLTLWYAAAVAPYDPDRALAALEMVARPVAEPMEPSVNVRPTEFAEYFDGDAGVNLGMHLSPWVAPTFVWVVLEGLLGLTWADGEPILNPRWPSGWNEVTIENLLTNAAGARATLTAQRIL